jgi:hypothetical protein
MPTKRVTDKKTIAPRRVRTTASTIEILDEKTLPSYEAVARRAYELFQNRGMSHGRDVEDWLAAERELMPR